MDGQAGKEALMHSYDEISNIKYWTEDGAYTYHTAWQVIRPQKEKPFFILIQFQANTCEGGKKNKNKNKKIYIYI